MYVYFFFKDVWEEYKKQLGDDIDPEEQSL